MEVIVEKRLAQQASTTLPVWGWTALALLLLALFMILSASGTLLAPVLGDTSGIFNYLHEFAHDGRHLLGVPCH
ncbi:MAG: CbtB-domain containing protein [Rubrobacter sp.]|nr:CbtB-domain containing protein [Rubrobacter sp.]